jgi:hypothetical protein
MPLTSPARPSRWVTPLAWLHHPARPHRLVRLLAWPRRVATPLAWAQHLARPHRLAGLQGVSVLVAQAVAPPNPGPQAPPGLTRPVTTIIAWGKWGVLVCGVAGLLICAGKMAIGHRNRATFAADGATGVPWVLGGLSLAAVAASVVGVFLR